MTKKAACPRCGHQDGEENLILIPFALTLVPGQASVAIPAEPQLPLKPVRLIIDPEIAEYFALEDIRVGRNSQIACVGSVAATLFPPIPAEGTQIHNIAGIDKIPVGCPISLHVRNRGNVAREFSAVIYAVTDFE